MSEPAEHSAFHHERRRGRAAGHHLESWLMQADQCRMAVERVLPDATLEIYFNLGNEGRHVYSGSPSDRLQPRRAWVVGPHDHALLIEKEVVACDIVGIRLRSLHAQQLFGVEAAELRGQVVDLDCLWGNEALGVHDQLGNIDRDNRLAFVERVVLQKLARREPHDGILAQRLFELLGRSAMSVSAAAACCNLSNKRLIESTERAVGLRPKALQRVLRHRAVLAEIHAKEKLGWAAIAARCGYFDQAHLVNDFRKLSGLTPGEYESTRSSVGVGFAPYILAKGRAKS